jgi:leucyl/phenylalanyl-tRNA---protein transferase
LLYPISYDYNSLTPGQILKGYSAGVFPMGNDDGSMSWYEANPRTIIPLNDDKNKFNIPRSLKQVINKNIYEIKTDTAFKTVMQYCSLRKPTWINKLIIENYTKLFKLGYAHSVEAWCENELAGGLYGVALNGAFFGESMFHNKDNASKVCVVRLYEILTKNNFLLFDIQMKTSVFEIFNAIDISKEDYLERLTVAMKSKNNFNVTKLGLGNEK